MKTGTVASWIAVVGLLFSAGCELDDLTGDAFGDSNDGYTLNITSQTWTPYYNDVGQLLYNVVVKGTATGPAGATLMVTTSGYGITFEASSWTQNGGTMTYTRKQGDRERTSWTETEFGAPPGKEIWIFLCDRVITATKVEVVATAPGGH